MSRQVSVVITDLDNTLFDWVDAWYRSFSAMLHVIQRKSGVNEDTLIAEIKQVHELHGTSEYAFLIEELPCLRVRHPGVDLTSEYSDAIAEYRRARSESLRLYPRVLETLNSLRLKGCLLVGYTESLAFYSNYRIRRLGLDSVLDFLYSPPDHDFPNDKTREQIRQYPEDHYTFAKTVHRYTPRGEVKPNPRLLTAIIAELGAARTETVYIGDSLMKDVLMAQEAGVFDVWAAYGSAHKREEYELLRKVTHWTPVAVQSERVLTEKDVTPSVTLREQFGELLDHIEPTSFRREERKHQRILQDG